MNVSQIVTWKAVISSSSKVSTVQCLNDALVWSMRLQYGFDVPFTIGYFRLWCSSWNIAFYIHFRPPPTSFLFLSVPVILIPYVQEVDTLYFVTGWAYASRHTILLGIGTATSIWCQSKYYSLFANIMSNGHNAAHNEACLYIYLV